GVGMPMARKRLAGCGQREAGAGAPMGGRADGGPACICGLNLGRWCRGGGLATGLLSKLVAAIVHTEHPIRINAMAKTRSIHPKQERLELDGETHRRDCECARCEAGFTPTELDREVAGRRLAGKQGRRAAERA